jgi:hypothetical protein
MVNIAYTLIGKGKGRKITLYELLEIINDKDAYFNKIKLILMKQFIIQMFYLKMLFYISVYCFYR